MEYIVKHKGKYKTIVYIVYPSDIHTVGATANPHKPFTTSLCVATNFYIVDCVTKERNADHVVTLVNISQST